eukprot:3051697-Pleurochrysis_carterae.AAC.1
MRRRDKTISGCQRNKFAGHFAGALSLLGSRSAQKVRTLSQWLCAAALNCHVMLCHSLLMNLFCAVLECWCYAHSCEGTSGERGHLKTFCKQAWLNDVALFVTVD